MSNIHTPKSIEDAPAAAQPLLEAVKKSIGAVPNLFRITANSPAALEAYLNLSGALSKGSLDAATRERIALAVAEVNGCDYCLAAHTYLGQNVAKLTSHEIITNRKGGSTDAKADVAVRFAREVALNRGAVDLAAVKTVQAAGYSEGEIVEIIAHVALNTLTNYLNIALDTEVDFPPAAKLAA